MAVYRVGDFLRDAEIYVVPDIQQRDRNPFTMQRAKTLFDCFRDKTFELNEVVRSIYISDGKEDLPRASYARGLLYAQNIEELENYAESHDGYLPNHVGTISLEFGGDNQIPLVSIDRPRAAKTLSATDHYERAMNAVDSNDQDLAIRELDACLCAKPEPLLAMEAYYNLSATIWQKFQFNERRGGSIADDEYLWVRGCNICLRRALTIYEHLPRKKQLEAGPIQLHQAITGSLSPTISYGSIVYKYGVREFRKVTGLPPLRCLTEIDMPLGR